MAVKIRLRRMGSRGRPFYRVVVADSRSPRDGRFIEALGYYDPRKDPPEIKIDGERTKLWLSRGAQPTDTAAALLKKEGILGMPPPSKEASTAEKPGGEVSTEQVTKEEEQIIEEPIATEESTEETSETKVKQARAARATRRKKTEEETDETAIQSESEESEQTEE